MGSLFKSFLFILFFISLSHSGFAQLARIHAVPVGDWQTQKELPIEYHYNSVSVFLLNEEKLAGLFDPAQFSKEERKMTKVHISDEVESLYFYLQIPSPKNEKDSLFVPLYAINVDKLNSFSSTTQQGRVLDKITDEELDGKPLNATARIEVLKKNRLLEIAYLLSKSINKLMEYQLFGGSNILYTTKNAQQFFEKRYKGSIVSEFSVPIIPQNDNYEYELNSAALFQIKWDFQSPIKVPKDNIWEDLKKWQKVTEENLRKKPTKIARLKQHPYLLILRYKSSYALPERHRLVVELTPSYLEERAQNLYEFRKGDMKYQMEEAFLLMLRDAMDLKRMSENYLHSRQKGEEDLNLLGETAGRLFDLQMISQKESLIDEKIETEKAYFRTNYSGVYEKLFKVIDKDCFLDRRLRQMQNSVHKLLELNDLDKETLAEADIYEYLKAFEPYRELAPKLKKEGPFFFNIMEAVQELEASLYQKAFKNDGLTEMEPIQWLEFQKDKYTFCIDCQEKADVEIDRINKAKRAQLLTQFKALQSQQLSIRTCFHKIQSIAEDSLNLNFPAPLQLEELDLQLYESYLGKVEYLKKLAMDFSVIEQIEEEILNLEELFDTISRFEKIQTQFCQQSCQLANGGFIEKGVLDCLAQCECHQIRP